MLTMVTETKQGVFPKPSEVPPGVSLLDSGLLGCPLVFPLAKDNHNLITKQ